MDRVHVGLEIKQIIETDPDFLVFEGMASVFGVLDSHNDIVVKGAFEESLSERMPKILWQHDMREPIGMPVEIRETEQGLYLKARLPRDDSLVKGRVMPQMKVGSINEMSIGFYTKKSEYDTEKDIRMLKQVDLREISLVTFASNEQSLVSDFKSQRDKLTVKDFENKDARTIERTLRESGFSKKLASYISSKLKGKEPENQGEPDNNDSELKSILALHQKFDEEQALMRIKKLTRT